MSKNVLLLNIDGQPLSITPLSTVSWQEAMKLYVLQRVNVLEWYEGWEIHTTTQTFTVPSVIATKEYVPLKNAGVNFSRQNVFVRDGFECQYCNKIHKMRDLTLDHVLPKSKGGKLTWTNTVTACKPCNHSKGNNERIVPKKLPKRPNFYQMYGNKNFPITIHDSKWLDYIVWPEEFVRYAYAA